MSQRLTKSQRLKSPQDFKRVYQNRQFGHTALFSFNVLGLPGSAASKLGVTVSKKVSKLAVERNRIKRHIREFYRRRQHTLDGAEIVITAKPGAANKGSQELKADLEQLWQKLLKWQGWYKHQKKRDQAEAAAKNGDG